MPRIRKNPTGVDPELLVKDAAKLMPAPTRRLFLRGGASLGERSILGKETVAGMHRVCPGALGSAEQGLDVQVAGEARNLKRLHSPRRRRTGDEVATAGHESVVRRHQSAQPR